MRVGPSDRRHLCYCSNIHPGESWSQVRRNLETHATAVKACVAPRQDFGIGLRLSAHAARELRQGSAMQEFHEFLERSGIYVFTVNAFPYGVFHGQVVKERVYLPDWRMRERLEYANLSADILSELLPESVSYGSLSTVPGAFGERARSPSQQEEIAALLREHVVHLAHLADREGRILVCALEPEPACLLETTADAVTFLEDRMFSSDKLRRFADAAGGNLAHAEETLRTHLGVCLDACHAAVEFEEPEASVQRLRKAAIRVGKLQVSAGLRLRQADAAAIDALRSFDDAIYLHQVVVSDHGSLRRFDDLEAAFAAHDGGSLRSDGTGPAEWRVHFHVPVFREQLGRFESTQSILAEFLDLQRRDPFTEHLEVETYTWNVLPEAYRREQIVEAIAGELDWTRRRLQP